MRVPGALPRWVICAAALGGALVAPASAGAATVVFNPVADARVEAGTPDTNYGTATELRTDGSPVMKSYLRFNVQGLTGEVVAATLRLQARNNATIGPEVRGVADNTWTEAGITYNNAPAMGSSVGTSKLVDGSRVYLNATPLVTGNGAVNVGLTTTSSSTFKFPSREVAAQAPQLVVQTKAPGDQLVAAAGDIACDPGTSAYNGGLGTATACRQMYTSELLLDPRIDAVLPLGDLQYDNATLTKFQQSYDPSWGRVKALTRPAPGNHEYRTAGAAGYFDYFNGSGNAMGPAGPRSTGYYSYDLGSWHVIALNSNCSSIGGCHAGSPQQQWLQADLAAHLGSCVLAYLHHPRFSSGTNHGSDPAMSPLWSTLQAAGADIILAGHEHNYERFSRQDATGVADPSGGIRQFVVGTGGKTHYGLSNVIPNSGARDTKSYGVLKLILGLTGYDWRFVPEAGAPFVDAGSDVCAGTTADAEPPGRPLALSASLSGSAVNLRWTATTDNDGVAGYRIFRNGTQIATSGVPTFTDTTAQSGGNTYTYTVAAYDSLGNVSPVSNAATVTTSGGLAFSPADDATIVSGSSSTNFGADPALKVDASPRQEFLIKFNVSGIGSSAIASAKLRLRNTNSSPFGGELRPVVDTTWQEETVTWGNAPAASTTVVGSLGAVSSGNWYEIDVGSHVIGDGVYSFRMVSPNSDGADYVSKEGTAGLGPELRITLASG